MNEYCSIKNNKCALCFKDNGEIYCGQKTGENRIRLMKKCPKEKIDRGRKKRGKRSDYPRGMKPEGHHYYPYYKEPAHVKLIKHDPIEIDWERGNELM